MKIQHITQRTVGQSGAEDGDVVARGPVENRVLVVDFPTQPLNDAAGCPVQFVLLITGLSALVLGGLLFLQHLIEYRDQPILKGTVVVVRHEQIANAIQSLGS